jgi:hypothetical protein
VEGCELRTLLSPLNIVGTAAADVINVVRTGPGAYTVTVNGTPTTASNVTSILVDASDGNDTLRLQSCDVPATLSGGDGNDILSVAQSSNNLNNVTAPATLDGGAGSDQLYVYDSSFAGSRDYAYDGATLTLSSTTIATSNFEYAQLRGSLGDDVITIAAVPATLALDVYGNSGNDEIIVTNLSQQLGNLQLIGEAGDDVFRLVDIGNGAGTRNTSVVGGDGADSTVLVERETIVAQRYTIAPATNNTVDSVVTRRIDANSPVNLTVRLVAPEASDWLEVQCSSVAGTNVTVSDPTISTALTGFAAVDTFNVSAIRRAAVINAGGGADVIDIGATGGRTISVNTGPGDDTLRLNAPVGGLCTVRLAGDDTLGLLGLNGNSLLNLVAGITDLRFNQLTTTGNPTINVADNVLIYDYNGISPLPIVADAVRAGNLQLTTGLRITSSLLASDRVVGVAGAGDVFSAFPANFAGQTVDASTVLVRLTLRGDSNLDGLVNFSDLLILARNYSVSSGALYTSGDSDFDGDVDFTDLLALAQNYNLSFGALGSSVMRASRTRR